MAYIEKLNEMDRISDQLHEKRMKRNRLIKTIASASYIVGLAVAVNGGYNITTARDTPLAKDPRFVESEDIASLTKYIENARAEIKPYGGYEGALDFAAKYASKTPVEGIDKPCERELLLSRLENTALEMDSMIEELDKKQKAIIETPEYKQAVSYINGKAVKGLKRLGIGAAVLFLTWVVSPLLKDRSDSRYYKEINRHRDRIFSSK